MKAPSSRMIARYEKHPQHPSQWRSRRRSFTVSAVASAVVIGVPGVWGVVEYVLHDDPPFVLLLALICSPLVVMLTYDVWISWWRERCLMLIWNDRPEWAWERLKGYHQDRMLQNPQERELRKRYNRDANRSLILLVLSAGIAAAVVSLALAHATSTVAIVLGVLTGSVCVLLLIRMLCAVVNHSRVHEQLLVHERELKALRDMSHELPDDALLVGALSDPMDAEHAAISAVFE